MNNPFKSLISGIFGKQYVSTGSEIELGTTVSSEKAHSFYFKALAFGLAVSYISNIISKCEIKHLVLNPKTNKVEETKDLLYYYLNVSPNRNETAFQAKNKFIFNYFYDSEALMFLKGNELYVADSFSRKKVPFSEDVFENISLDGSNVTFTRKCSDVLYVESKNYKVSSLVSLLLSEYEDLFSYAKTAAADATADKWSYDAGQLDVGDDKEKQKNRERLKKSISDFIEKPKSVLPIYIGHGLTHIYKGDGKVDITPIQNIRKEMFELVAEAFKMPVSILYGNMTNTKDILNAWASVEIDPLCKFLSEALCKTFLSVEDYLSGSRLVIDTTALFHMDWFDMCEKGDKAICSGVFNIDEIRGKIGEEPLNTDFSRQHWMTKNYDRIENVMSGSADS